MIKIIGVREKCIEQVESLENLKPEKYSIVWIDCYDPRDEELYKISKFLEVSINDLQAGLDDQEIPRIEEEENYYLIIYRTPLLEEYSTSILGIFIKDNIVLTIHPEKIKSIERIYNIVITRNPNVFKSIGFFIYVILNEVTRSYSRILVSLEDELEELEDKIISGFDQKIIEKILYLRKTLVYFHKALIANRDVLVLLKRKYLPIIGKEDKENFEDLYYDTLQLIDMSATYREVLTSMMDISLSLENIKMNQIVKILTMVTTIFAIPMWITGIFGMNFKYMPLLSSPYGFWISFTFMLLSIIFFIYVFKKMRWI
ncbi:magnesium/cobalt transporter CorA [Methanocaldococcus infernus]